MAVPIGIGNWVSTSGFRHLCLPPLVLMAREHYGELAFAMQCSLVMQRIKLSKVERVTKKGGMASKGVPGGEQGAKRQHIGVKLLFIH